MLTSSFEWKILDFFDQFKCEFLNKFFQYVSEIFGIISIILILMLIYWCFSKEKAFPMDSAECCVGCCGLILFKLRRRHQHQYQ